MSEFNRDPRESAGTREYQRPPAEYSAAEERKDYRENKIGEENVRPPRKKRGSATALSRLLTAFAVAAVVIAAAVSTGMFAEKSSAEIVDVSVTDTEVHYAVTVDAGENLSVVLFNDFTKRETALKQGENSGTFTALKPNVSYTLAVVVPAAFGAEKTVTERAVKTDLLPAPVPPAPVSVWNGVSHRCTCNIDGYFHFTMDFDDPNGYFTDFSAKLEDAAGNVSYCVFSEDLHAEQRIDVTLTAALWGKTAKFTLTYRTSDPSAPEETVQYSAEVKI